MARKKAETKVEETKVEETVVKEEELAEVTERTEESFTEGEEIEALPVEPVKEAVKKKTEKKKAEEKNTEEKEETEAERIVKKASNAFFGQLRHKNGQLSTPEAREYRETRDKLRELEKRIENGKKFQFLIDYVDNETGDLQHTDESGVVYVVAAEKIKELFPEYDARMGGYLLGVNVTGTIAAVHKSKNRVDVAITKEDMPEDRMKRMGRRNISGHADALREVLLDSIKKDGTTKRRVEVIGLVTKVTETEAHIDMYGTGLIGVVTAKNFRRSYTWDMREFVKEGDSLSGIVTGYRQASATEPEAFYVHRRGVMDYKNRRLNLKKGDTLVIKCRQKPDNKTYFWSTSTACAGVDIMTDYSTRMSKEHIKEGNYYKARIRDVRATYEKGVLIRATPYEDVNID